MTGFGPWPVSLSLILGICPRLASISTMAAGASMSWKWTGGGSADCWRHRSRHRHQETNHMPVQGDQEDARLLQLGAAEQEDDDENDNRHRDIHPVECQLVPWMHVGAPRRGV